jgi:hypothetical protein
MIARLVRRGGVAVVGPMLGLLGAACAVGPAATRQPVDLAFGPTYPAQPPAGRAVRIDSASLSDDRRALAVSFVGGPGYLRSDACSTDYEPWLAARGDMLDVTVVQIAHPDQAVLPPNAGCTLEGHGHRFLLALAAPFGGTTVNDLSGGTLFVAAPAGLARATSLPAGWSLQRSFEQEPGPPPIWVQVYAPGPVADAGPVEGPGRLVLYQALGISGEWDDVRAEKARERGGSPTDVSVHDVPLKAWTDPSTGELLLAWTLNGRSFGLIGNLADMTLQDLVTAAESVTSAGQ